jgi:hypothetical protein
MSITEKLAFTYIFAVGLALIMFTQVNWEWKNAALVVFGVVNILFVVYFAFGLDRIKVSITKE